MLSPQDIAYGIAGLAVYQLLRVSVQSVVKQLYPRFYSTLQENPSRKLRPYFVFPVGIILTLFTTPVCIGAFTLTPASSDSFATQNLSPTEKICMASRGILWVSELPLLSFSSEYIAHHVLSLSSLTTILLAGLPRRPLYLIYAGLVTELFSDTTAILRYHDFNAENSKLFRRLALTNALSLIALRIIPTFAFAYTIFMPLSNVQAVLYMISITFYAGYLLRLSLKQLSSLGYIQLVSDGSAYIRILGSYDFPLFSVLLGTAMAAAQLSTVALYAATQSRPLNELEVRSVAATSFGCAAAGLLGARVFNVLLDSVITLLPHDSPSEKKQHTEYDVFLGRIRAPRGRTALALRAAPSRGSTNLITTPFWRKSGISIQGGLLMTMLFILYANTLTPSLDRTTLLGSMALSLPLGEGIGRIGCYVAGCCGSKLQNGKEKHVAVQLLSSTANLGAYISLALSVLMADVPLAFAGALALISNGVVRFLVDPLRASTDNSQEGIATTTAFAFGQMILSTGILASLMLASGQGILLATLAAISYTIGVFAGAYAFRFAWLKIAHQPSLLARIKPALRPMTGVGVFAVVIVYLTFKNHLSTASSLETAPQEIAGAASNPWTFTSNPLFLTNIFITGSLPLLTGSKGISKCGS